jgi:hypothetical protein
VSQQELFHADEYDALTEDCKAIGVKQLAALLKPDSDIENAAKWVSNCLDRKRDQDFDPPHYTIIVNEARKKGSFAYVTYLMRATYFEPPIPKVYDIEIQRVGDQMMKLQETIRQCTENLQNINRELKK